VKVVLAIAGVLLLFYGLRGSMHRSNPPGVVVPEEPSQSATVERTWDKKGYTITALARFQMRGLVVSTERYWFDPGAALSPVDFVLAWGPLSDEAALEQFGFSQGGRWFRYSPRGQAPSAELMSHLANMHMIPANDQVEKELKSVASRDIVSLSGYLVQVNGANGSSRISWCLKVKSPSILKSKCSV